MRRTLPLFVVAAVACASHATLGQSAEPALTAQAPTAALDSVRLILQSLCSDCHRPQVIAEPPGPLPPVNDIIGRAKMMYDLIHLALQTDSTRLITLSLDQVGAVPPISGVTDAYHQLSHHGQEPTKIAQLRIIELAHLRAFAGLLQKLKTTEEAGATLLDRTMLLLGSNLGNASSHDTHNLPILLAGGGFRHSQHLAHNGSRRRRAELVNC